MAKNSTTVTEKREMGQVGKDSFSGNSLKKQVLQVNKEELRRDTETKK